MDFAMPYLIQVMREYTSKVDKLEESEAARVEEKKEEEYKPVVMETQPQLMLTGPIGFNNSTSAPSGGGSTYAGAPGNSFPQGGMPYQGYSM